MYGVIYLITNKLDGMKYVGQTTRTIDERFKEHKRHKKFFIGNAINKDGAKNFTIEVIEECETQEQLSEREKYWIAYFDCIAPKGYNLTDGGESNWNHLPEVRAKISAANSGENHPMFGKHHTDEAKARMSAGITGRKQSEETKAILSAIQTTKHAVICIETDEIFDSVAAVERNTKINHSGIVKACQNHQCTASGKHFWFLEDFNAAAEIVIPPPKTRPQKRAIICLETGQIFETIRQAAKWLGMVHGAVSRACRKHYAAGGYHFRYLEEYQNSQS